MAGVGFIGAGVILHDEKHNDVQNLTAAATVWVTAALGIACALAAWHVVWIGVGLTLLILLSGPFERAAMRLLHKTGAARKAGDDDGTRRQR
jgi:putative Mg2+ transporter-C (MgtC) family protein